MVFTRDPNSGQRGLYGEYLVQAQGEDIVGGILTPHLIDDERGGGLRDVWPRIYDDLAATVETLERAFGDMQEVEFTVEEGALKLLQTRRAKRSAMASVEIAVDLAEPGGSHVIRRCALFQSMKLNSCCTPSRSKGGASGCDQGSPKFAWCCVWRNCIHRDGGH